MATGSLLRFNGGQMLRTSRSRPSHINLSTFKRPMKVTAAFHSQSYWASINADIDAHIKHVIPVRPPVSVFEPMHRLAVDPPPSTAPALCIAACELVGGCREQAINAAAALHLMHAAAFAHEHLPLTDRVKPGKTNRIHHVFNPNVELLTGDGLVPFGYELLARSDEDNSDRILRVIIEITQAMGSEGFVDGQYHEMKLEELDGKESWSVEMIRYVCERKEGRLHACGAVCGAIMGGGSEEEIERMRKYGFMVGVVQGMLYWVGRTRDKELMKMAEDMRKLALEELKGFSAEKIGAISSILESNFCSV